jgi:hypothetical protein
MAEDPIIVQREPRVHGELLDTKEWLTRYGQYRQDIIGVLRNIPAFVEASRQLTSDGLYRISWPQEVITAIREGRAVWRPGQDGFFHAVVRGPEGKILKHLPLERVSPAQLSPVIQLAVQSILSEVIERLEALDRKVMAILRGQVEDRIGTLLGAEDQYHQALRVSGERRYTLLENCVTPLNNARGRCLAHVRSELEKLDFREPGWWRFWEYLPGRISAGDRIRESMESIHLHFGAAIRATRYLEEIYEELGQPAAAKEVLSTFADRVSGILPLGRKGARWLPYNRGNSPEMLWDLAHQMIEGPFSRMQGLLTASPLPVEVEVEASEIRERKNE